MAEDIHEDQQRIQLSKLVDECMQRVLDDAKAGLSTLEVLARLWPSFAHEFRERTRDRRAELVGSLSIYERHSKLRVDVLEELKGWLTTDPHYLTLTEPVRKLQELEDEALDLKTQLLQLSQRNLALNIQLLRIDVTEGKVPTAIDRRRVEQRRSRAPTDAKYVRYWHGADVTVLEVVDSNYQIRSGDTVVTTRHAGALGRIFHRLADMSEGALDYMKKYQFYGETAGAVNRLLQRTPNATETEVLLAALDGAETVLASWENRRQR